MRHKEVLATVFHFVKIEFTFFTNILKKVVVKERGQCYNVKSFKFVACENGRNKGKQAIKFELRIAI